MGLLNLDLLTGQIDEAIRLKESLREPAALRNLADIGRLMADVVARGGKVLLCGNGGSAADCQHWEGEMLGRFKKERRAFPFISLTTNTSVLTSLANDYDYNCVFARQVEGLGGKGDLLAAFSTSGKSANIIRAAEAARRQGLTVVGFTGRAPNPLASLSDRAFAVPSDDTPRIQEVHIFAVHLICGLVEDTLV